MHDGSSIHVQVCTGSCLRSVLVQFYSPVLVVLCPKKLNHCQHLIWLKPHLIIFSLICFGLFAGMASLCSCFVCDRSHCQTVWYCSVLYSTDCAILYSLCTYCTVGYSIVWYCTDCTVGYGTVLYGRYLTVRYCTDCTEVNWTVLYMFGTVLTVWYCTIY